MARKRKPPPTLTPDERELLLRAAGLFEADDGIRSSAGVRPLVRKLSHCWRNWLTARPDEERVLRDLARRGLARVEREPPSEWLPEPAFALTAAGLDALWSSWEVRQCPT